MDELPEFRRAVIDSLRQPMEEHRVQIARAQGNVSYPADMMLVAAMNPCPCGYSGDQTRECRCSPSQVKKYRRRISGPLLDRIDIQIAVRALPPKDLEGLPGGDSSAAIRERVVAARRRQSERYAAMDSILVNADVPGRLLRDVCRLTAKAAGEIRSSLERLELSARAYDRVLRVSRTIADLAGKDEVDEECVMEAAGYRALDQGDGDSGDFWS